MKSKKIIIISVISVVVLSLVIGAIYFNTHYAVINKKIYKNDVTEIHPYLSMTDIKEINKCTEIEKLHLSGTSENSFSKFRNFHKLNHLLILNSEISSSDSEKISTFDNLKELNFCTTTVDLKVSIVIQFLQ